MSDALIALAGVVVGGLGQWLLMRSQQRAENDRLMIQLRSERQQQNHLAWQERFQEAITSLVTTTDPELRKSLKSEQLIPLIHRAQLCLNPELPAHAKCNSDLNRLALATTGWSGPTDLAALLAAHNALIESARQVLWLPGK